MDENTCIQNEGLEKKQGIRKMRGGGGLIKSILKLIVLTIVKTNFLWYNTSLINHNPWTFFTKSKGKTLMSFKWKGNEWTTRIIFHEIRYSKISAKQKHDWIMNDTFNRKIYSYNCLLHLFLKIIYRLVSQFSGKFTICQGASLGIFW